MTGPEEEELSGAVTNRLRCGVGGKTHQNGSKHLRMGELPAFFVFHQTANQIHNTVCHF